MGKTKKLADIKEENTAACHDPSQCIGFAKIKNCIAEKLHHVAEALCETAADQETPSGIAHYGKQASEWIDKSAIYVRQFDYQQADARVRDFVGQSPGRSILIAGGVGLVIGAVLRRR